MNALVVLREAPLGVREPLVSMREPLVSLGEVLAGTRRYQRSV
jgi:hypothetical protein